MYLSRFFLIGLFSFHLYAEGAPIKADSSIEPALETKSPASAPINKDMPGQKTYERYCVACHGSGLVGAPKFRDDKDWSARLSGKTTDDLVSSAIKGLNAMPTKGTCYECSAEDIKAAIEYMLPQS